MGLLLVLHSGMTSDGIQCTTLGARDQTQVDDVQSKFLLLLQFHHQRLMRIIGEMMKSGGWVIILKRSLFPIIQHFVALP